MTMIDVQAVISPLGRDPAVLLGEHGTVAVAAPTEAAAPIATAETRADDHHHPDPRRRWPQTRRRWTDSPSQTPARTPTRRSHLSGCGLLMLPA